MCSNFDIDLSQKLELKDLLKIMEALRSENGCDWDKAQTHQSIRREFLEETYEAIEAIDNADPELLREELGDVLLQLVFHSQIEKEIGNFDFYDVINDIASKLVIRHPHVFSDTQVNSTDEILSNWDKIKIETKGQKDIKENIQSITKAMPSLMRYQKFVKKATKYNIKEFDSAFIEGDITENSIAVALAQIVNLAEKNGIDAEEALAKYTQNIINKI